MSDAFDTLEKSKSRGGGGGDYAPWWEPEEGEEIIGILVEKHPYTDPGGEDHPVGTIRSVGRGDLAEGEEVATPTHSNIEGFIGNTNVGDVVLVEYEGKVKANTGREMNAYQSSRLREAEWRETDQAEDFQAVWEGSSHFDSDNADTTTDEPDDSGNDSDIPDKAIEFAGDVVKMNDGEVTLDELDEYLNDVRDYGVDAKETAEAAGLTIDGDTVSN